jgi:hypothetical protein
LVINTHRSSKMYNQDLFSRMDQFYNTSDPEEANIDGIPYGRQY